MSWLFGMKSQPQVPPDFAPPPPGGDPSDPNQQGQPGGAAGQQQAGSKSSYSFDSSALERAAKAAKELERNPNAKQALELSRLQEISRHKEMELQTKQVEAQIQAMKSDSQKVAEEERRKTLHEETKHAKSVRLFLNILLKNIN